MAEPGAPFKRAVIAGLVEPLALYGFELRECDEVHRGANALVANDHLALRVTHDRLEGEMAVTISLLGGAERPIDRVLDPERPRGFKHRGIPRSAPSSFIEAQLRRLSEALISQAPAVLADYEDADRLLGG